MKIFNSIKRIIKMGRYYHEHNGTTFWYRGISLHREDGPAVEFPDGSKFWYLNGKYHREDMPALEYSNGLKIWYLNGEYHRVGGPSIEWKDGDKCWHIHNRSYRLESYCEEVIRLGYMTEEEVALMILKYS